MEKSERCWSLVCPDRIAMNDEIVEEVCECFICSIVVNENDAAINNCELCNKWFHRNCTDIKQPLYDMLDPEQGDPRNGIQWYCETCLPTITTLIANFQKQRDAQTQIVSTGT